MTAIDERSSEWMNQGFRLFAENALLLMVCGLVALVVTGVSLGLLAGPMLAGLALIIVNLMDARLAKPTLNDLLKGFDYLKETIPVTLFIYALAAAFIVLHVVPVIGPIVAWLVVSAGVSLAAMSVFHLIVRKVSPVDAARGWFDLFKQSWGSLTGFFILATLTGASGLLFFLVGTGVTVPLQLCMLGCAYQDIQSRSAAI